MTVEEHYSVERNDINGEQFEFRNYEAEAKRAVNRAKRLYARDKDVDFNDLVGRTIAKNETNGHYTVIVVEPAA